MAYNQFNNLLQNLGNLTQTDQKRQIVSVNGINEAKNYFLTRGENIILRDVNDDVIYVKTCDDSGKYGLKVYQCEDITNKALTDSAPLDFSSIKSEITDLKSEIKNVMEILKNEHNVSKHFERNKPSVTD